jgi:Holliday junction resolvase RusA-like endonuclease
MLTFEILGNPVPQKQTRFIRSSGRTYNPSKKHIEAIQRQIRPLAPKEPLKCPITLQLYFYLPIPASTPRRLKDLMLEGRVRHIKKPDFDNLAYLVTNALKGIVYQDDSQIDWCNIQKKYGMQPATIIHVIPSGETQCK